MRGFAFYVYEKIPAKISPTIRNFQEGNFESLVLEAKMGSKIFTVSQIYKPPSADDKKYFDNLEALMCEQIKILFH